MEKLFQNAVSDIRQVFWSSVRKRGEWFTYIQPSDELNTSPIVKRTICPPHTLLNGGPVLNVGPEV